MNDTEIKESIRKTWDHQSLTYDSTPGHRIGTQEEKNAWMAELARNIPLSSGKILDVGCGTGAMGLLCAEMGHQVTGVDLSLAMMEKAREKADEMNLSFDLQKGDAEHLPFDDESFDIIINRHLLWTLPHPVDALIEWHRVLKTGGLVLIMDGVWYDKTLGTRVKRTLSDGLSRLFEGNNAHRRSYDDHLRDHLTYDGGVPEEVVHTYLERSGFSDITFQDLMYIRELQKSDTPWYRRLVQTRSYYLLAGRKS